MKIVYFRKKNLLNLLNPLENVIVIGYMNWDHKKDTSPLLTKKSYDVWVNLIIGPNGWPYDNKSHQILPGHCLLQKC